MISDHKEDVITILRRMIEKIESAKFVRLRVVEGSQAIRYISGEYGEVVCERIKGRETISLTIDLNGGA